MTKSRAAPLPPDPFEDAERALARRYVAGEITIEKAEEIAAGGRWLAFMRRANGLDRTRERLEKELTRIAEDLRRTRAAEMIAIEAAVFYLIEYEAKKHERREREARAEEPEEDEEDRLYKEHARAWRNSRARENI